MSRAEPTRVLTVEDDAAIRRMVVRILEDAGYVVDEADDAFSAMELLGAQRPDIILMDVRLPRIDGFDLLARIRRASDVPIIMLTGRGREEERIRGLRLGADDYVLKPFSHGELVARIESVLRRARPSGRHAAPAEGLTLTFPGLEINRIAREVRVGDRPIPLTSREFDVLVFLASSPRQVFSREQLLRQVWESSADWQNPATVTEHVRRIRRKIEDDPLAPRWITTVRGAGYRFEP